MLEFQNVTIYQKKRKIVDNLNLKLADGVIFGLLGSDNTAKSAILRAAAGGEKPARGRIILDDALVYPVEKSYQNMGYMPKNYLFYQQLTVEEYFEFFLALYKVNGRYRERRVEEVLDFLELKDYRNSFLVEIPKDIKPFFALGKTILHQPSWIFLDQPFDDLSPSYRKKMIDLLEMLWEQGSSLVIHSQMYSDLTGFFTDIALVEEGKIVAQGSLESIYEEALRESPIRFKVLEGMDAALKVLRENDLVCRVTVDGEDVSILFSGGDHEEAVLLRQLVEAGSLIYSYMRDPMDLDQMKWR